MAVYIVQYYTHALGGISNYVYLGRESWEKETRMNARERCTLNLQGSIRVTPEV